MKTIRANGTPHVGMAPHVRAVFLRSATQHVGIAAAPLRLQRALAEVDALERALASSQQESIIAQQQVEIFKKTNAHLRGLAVEREHEVAKIRHFAYHDDLTGLPNRTLLLDRLNQALARAKRQRKQLALLFLDLDRFKDINDRLGHAVGDKLLQRVAERLLSCIRGCDTACRYGGDEFILLLSDVDDAKRAIDVAQKIQARLARPYIVDDYSIAVTACIGVAVYPVDGMSEIDLIKQADVAMYRAKILHRSSIARTRLSSSDRV